MFLWWFLIQPVLEISVRHWGIKCALRLPPGSALRFPVLWFWRRLGPSLFAFPPSNGHGINHLGLWWTAGGPFLIWPLPTAFGISRLEPAARHATSQSRFPLGLNDANYCDGIARILVLVLAFFTLCAPSVTAKVCEKSCGI